jgi:hypothetical protein
LTSTTSHIPEKLNRLQAALESLESHNVTVSQLVLSLLQEPRLQNQAAVDNLVSNTTEILMAFADNPLTSISTLEWASNLMKAHYASSIWELT